MIRIFAVALLCVVAVSCSGGSHSLKPVDEAAYRKLVSQNKGKVVYVDFWATWCEPCREEMPFLAQLSVKYGGQGFKLITISADEPEQEGVVRQFVAQHKIPGYIKHAGNNEQFINAIDPKWSGALPAGFLYDRQGQKARSYIGEVEPAALEEAIRKLL